MSHNYRHVYNVAFSELSFCARMYYRHSYMVFVLLYIADKGTRGSKKIYPRKVIQYGIRTIKGILSAFVKITE